MKETGIQELNAYIIFIFLFTSSFKFVIFFSVLYINF